MPEHAAETMGALLDQAARENGQGPALIRAGGAVTTYRELKVQADLAAAGLIRLGIEKGDHVAVWASNRPEWVVCQFALAKAGAVLSTLEPGVAEQAFFDQMADSDARVLFFEPAAAGGDLADLARRLCPQPNPAQPGRVAAPALPRLGRLVSLAPGQSAGAMSWQQLLELGRQAGPEALEKRSREISGASLATLLYTSGTTGRPKGVLSGHGSLVAVSRASAANMGTGPGDRFCLTVPLFHMFGCVCVVAAAVAAKAALVFPAAAMDPESALLAASQEKCSVIFGSPNFFLAMMACESYGKVDISSLRTGIMGGASCPLEVMKRVVEEMGVEHILVGYGQTEAGSWATQTRPDDPLDLRVSTVGRALPGVTTMIADPVSGQALPPGQIGEFRARGFNMAGYYKNPAATAKALDAAGWLHTGDLGASDAHGNIRIVGRLTEVITKNGRAVYPVMIEEACYRHPAVGVAAAFGVADEGAGEEVALWVKPAEGESLTPADLAEFLKQELPADHQPRFIELVQSFPQTAVGKVQRFKMRQMFEKSRAS